MNQSLEIDDSQKFQQTVGKDVPGLPPRSSAMKGSTLNPGGSKMRTSERVTFRAEDSEITIPRQKSFFTRDRIKSFCQTVPWLRCLVVLAWGSLPLFCAFFFFEA